MSISIFSTPNSIYKRAVCFDGVRGYIFYAISKSNLPCTLWGPVSIIKLIITVKCALGIEMFGLGIKLGIKTCGLGI